MKLSKEDAYIIELERKIRKYQAFTTACNNQEPECTKYHNKAMKLLNEEAGFIFDLHGNYRKDKNYLLPWLEGDVNKPYEIESRIAP